MLIIDNNSKIVIVRITTIITMIIYIYIYVYVYTHKIHACIHT